MFPTNNACLLEKLHLVFMFSMNEYAHRTTGQRLLCIIDIFFKCNWVDTRWQQYSTHLHTNSTQNNTINKFGWKTFWDIQIIINILKEICLNVQKEYYSVSLYKYK